MWQPVLMISGYFISVLGLAMLFPAALDVYDTGNSWSPFFSSSIIALFLGMSMFLANKIRIDKVSLQQGYLLTVVSWFSVTLIASIPFILYGTRRKLGRRRIRSLFGNQHHRRNHYHQS